MSQLWKKKQLLILLLKRIKKWHQTGNVFYDMKKYYGNFPTKMKVLPISEIPHKSKAFISILDLSFSLKLTPHGHVPSVNKNREKTAPGGAIDQIGHVLLRLIRAFAEAPDCANISRKNGISRMVLGG